MVPAPTAEFIESVAFEWVSEEDKFSLVASHEKVFGVRLTRSVVKRTMDPAELSLIKGSMVWGLWMMSPEAFPDRFSGVPKNIREIRYERDKNSEVLTPRDVVVGFLRELDSGQVPGINFAMVIWRQSYPDPDDGAEISSLTYNCNSEDTHSMVGILEDVKMTVLRPEL